MLEAGADYTQQLSVDLPEGISGDYYVIVSTDASNLVTEVFGENDNTLVTTSTFHVDLAPYPDMQVEDLAVDWSPSDDPPVAATITWDTANRGIGDASGGWQEKVSITNVTTGQVINYFYDVSGDLAADQSRSRSASVSLVTAGRYQVQVTTDTSDQFFEFNAIGHDAAEQNNSSTTEFVIPGPDLIVESITAPSGLLVGNPASGEVTWTVKNQGPVSGTVDEWNDHVMFSFNEIVGDGDDVSLGSFQHLGQLIASDAVLHKIPNRDVPRESPR